MKDLNLFYGHEAARHHAVQYRKEGVDFFLRIDDLDHHRQILGKAQDLGRMNVARMTKADMASQHSRSAKMHLPSFQYDSLMQRQTLKLGVFSEEDTEQDSVPRNLHIQIPFIALIAPASRAPAHTEIRQSATDKPVYVPP